ncbi:MAG: ester cyclase [Methyloceanibacter sp.]|uniref:ester cyclase n=1 Tax=Methyloceanibacter sp. TaxID=1965321 RepID=UPI003D6CAB6B
MPAIEQNKALAKRFIEEVWNQGRLEVADELLHPNLITHDADGGVTKGRDAFKRFISDFRAANRGLHFSVEDQLGEGSEVATRVTIKSDKTNLTGIGIVRIADGRIVEQWADTDPLRASAKSAAFG